MTILANASDKLLTMGDLYYCTDTLDFTAFTKLTATNQATVKSELDLYNFSTVGHIDDFTISHSLQNEEIIRAGNCGVGELARLSQKTPTISFTWLDVNNRPVFDAMLGLDLLTVAGTPVAVTGEVIAAAGKSAGDVYIVANKNGAGTVVTSIVVDDNGTPLVLNTNYTVNLDTDGSITGTAGTTYITFLTDTSANQIDIDYSYTPNASTLDGYNIEKEAVPYGLYKFVSCKSATDATNGIQDTVYFRKYVLSGELTEKYVLLSEDTNFEGTECSFIGVNGGWYLKSKATVTL